MRPRVIIVTVAALAAVTVAAIVVVRAGGDGAAPPAALPEQTLRAGESDVTLQPQHVDGTRAEFEVVLDTHAVELDMYLAAGATLRVDTREWLPASWEGGGPGGHHREGRLRFPASGLVGGAFELRLAGFDTPLTATWTDEGDR